MRKIVCFLLEVLRIRPAEQLVMFTGASILARSEEAVRQSGLSIVEAQKQIHELSRKTQATNVYCRMADRHAPHRSEATRLCDESVSRAVSSWVNRKQDLTNAHESNLLMRKAAYAQIGENPQLRYVMLDGRYQNACALPSRKLTRRQRQFC